MAEIRAMSEIRAITVPEDPGLRLAVWAELHQVMQHVRRLLAAEGLRGEQLLHPLELGESVGGQESRPQLGIGILRWRAAHQVAKAAHRPLRQGAEDVVEL